MNANHKKDTETETIVSSSHKNRKKISPRAISIASVALVIVIITTYYFLINPSNLTKITNQIISVVTNTPYIEPIQTPTPTPITKPANIFLIPELNLKLTLPDGLDGLKYKVITFANSNDMAAGFTTSTLEQMDSKVPNTIHYCTADNGPLGGISRIAQATVDNSIANGTNYPSNIKIKKIDSTYITYEGPQGGCSNSKDVNDLMNEQANLLKMAAETATNIK